MTGAAVAIDEEMVAPEGSEGGLIGVLVAGPRGGLLKP